MNLFDLRARVHRLDELARGLAKEVSLWKGGNDPLLYLERKAYLGAIQDALAGVESARVVLARVRRRLEMENEPQRHRDTDKKKGSTTDHTDGDG
jgi:hypothetical protein